MAKFKGTVELIGGLTPKNNGDFPLVIAKDIQVDEAGTRLDQKLQELSTGGGGSGDNSAVVVEILNSDGVATASHSASEIFNLAQLGKVLVAHVVGENSETYYQYSRANVADDGSVIEAVFSITLVGEQLGDVTTYYVSVDDSKDVTISYDELLIGGDSSDSDDIQNVMQTVDELQLKLDGFELKGGSVKGYIDDGLSDKSDIDHNHDAIYLRLMHDVATDAHNDIRLLIQRLDERLTAAKVNVDDIIDNLTTNAADKPLSAAQGAALKALIDNLDIPTALKNPNALTVCGKTYDGSEAVTVTTDEIVAAVVAALPDWKEVAV